MIFIELHMGNSSEHAHILHGLFNVETTFRVGCMENKETENGNGKRKYLSCVKLTTITILCFLTWKWTWKVESWVVGSLSNLSSFNEQQDKVAWDKGVLQSMLPTPLVDQSEWSEPVWLIWKLSTWKSSIGGQNLRTEYIQLSQVTDDVRQDCMEK